jgi:hypothetical protein
VSRVDAYPGHGALLLRSYDNPNGNGAPVLLPLRHAAFSYDNALAVIALLDCHAPVQARRIGAALAAAALHDTRLRDAYRAGPLAGAMPAPNGWRDPASGRWVNATSAWEGAYQDASLSGNVAWTALALLALYRATGAAHWRDAAAHLARWVVEHASDARGAGGYAGGIEVHFRVPRRARWKSTEHNIDLVALFAWLARIDAPGGDWPADEQRARRFVQAQWDARSGHFWMGTKDDGVTPLHSPSALDVQTWAPLLPQAPHAWRRALHWIERMNAVSGGFDFTDDRDGMWTEGTAQAALAYRYTGQPARAVALLASVARQASPGGYLYATPQARISAIHGGYHHQPCLAATAWAAIAASGRNPYLPAP